MRSVTTRALAALALAVGIAGVPVEQVAACSCGLMAPAEAARVAQLAFTGTVTNIAEAAPEGRLVGRPTTLYDFAVDGVAKGELASNTVSVWAGGDGGMCGITFNLDERWLIFASVTEHGLSTHMCAGNVALGPDEVPPLPVAAPAAGATQAPSGLPVGVIVPVVGVGALAALAGLMFWRADRPT